MTDIKIFEAKFPDEEIRYQYRWTPALDTGDSLVLNEIQAVPAGVEGLEAEVISTVDNVTTIWLRGGTPGLGRVQFSAKTTSGETLGDNVYCTIKKR